MRERNYFASSFRLNEKGSRVEGTDETALMKNVMGEGKGKRGQGKGDPEGAAVAVKS